MQNCSKLNLKLFKQYQNEFQIKIVCVGTSWLIWQELSRLINLGQFTKTNIFEYGLYFILLRANFILFYCFIHSIGQEYILYINAYVSPTFKILVYQCLFYFHFYLGWQKTFLFFYGNYETYDEIIPSISNQ